MPTLAAEQIGVPHCFARPRSNIRTYTVSRSDMSLACLPSRLPIKLPDGTRNEQDALLVGPQEYAYFFSDDGFTSLIDTGQILPEIKWTDDGEGRSQAIALMLKVVT
jgi:hypothetical protein